MSVEESVFGTILLNMTGDVAITWEDSDDLRILTYIQKKMDEGYVFFIMEKKFFNIVKRKKYINNVNDISADRTVYLDDEDAEKLAKDNIIQIATVNNGNNFNTTRKARNAAEAASNQTVGVRPLRGG